MRNACSTLVVCAAAHDGVPCSFLLSLRPRCRVADFSLSLSLSPLSSLSFRAPRTFSLPPLPAPRPFCTYATSTLGRFIRRNAFRAGSNSSSTRRWPVFIPNVIARDQRLISLLITILHTSYTHSDIKLFFNDQATFSIVIQLLRVIVFCYVLLNTRTLKKKFFPVQ